MRNLVNSCLMSVVTLLPVQPCMAEQTKKDTGLELLPQDGQAMPPGQQQTDIYDIYGPLPLPDPIGWLPFVIAGILLIAILSLLLFLFYKRKKKSVIPSIPPHVTALAELEKARKYLINNQSLIYAERISEILRRYIEKRFTISSTRQTTSEFLYTIQRTVSGDGSALLPFRDELSKCMLQCDLAKYAHKTTDIASMEEMENGVQRFIDSTKPSEEEN